MLSALVAGTAFVQIRGARIRSRRTEMDVKGVAIATSTANSTYQWDVERGRPNVPAARRLLAFYRGWPGQTVSLIVNAIAILLGGWLHRGIFQRHIYGVPAGLLRESKRKAYQRFTIAFCRPFRAPAAALARTEVAPVLGAFGRVLHISDESYEGSELDTPRFDVDPISIETAFTPDELGDWIDAMPSTAKAWKELMEAYIANADVAVIDVTHASDNIAWEMARALQLLGPLRVLLIANERTPAALEALAAFELETLEDSHLLLYGSSKASSRAFRAGVIRWMDRLAA